MFSIKFEPVRLAALIRSLLIMVGAFGLNFSAEQIATIMLGVETVLAVVVRNRVSPV